jgi:Tfp pilus assembly protein PilF
VIAGKATGYGLRATGGGPRVVAVAVAGLAFLLACAGAQKPAAPTSEAAVAPPPQPAGPITGLPGEAPVALSTPARSSFEEGVQLEAAGDLAGAATAFEKAFQADPAAAFAGVNAGLCRERMGDAAGARALYGKVLDRTPTFFPAAQDLVRLDARDGRGADAEAEMRARLQKDPDAVALRNGLAEALLAQGKLDAAEEAARQALKIEEKNVPAMVNLATVYARKKRFELAKMVLDNARQIDDRDPSIWNRLGFVELSLGDRALALESFRTAAALRPDYPEAHTNYGALLADAEDFQNAATELEQAVRYAPTSAVAWMNLGNAYRGLKEFEKAEDAYRKALKLDPRLNDANYDLAILYLDGDKPGIPALQRLQTGVGFLDAYEQGGGKDVRLAAYRKDAGRALEREKKRLEREEKDRLRRDAEAKKKADEPQPGVVPAGSADAGTTPAGTGDQPAATAATPKPDAPAAPAKKKPAAKKKKPAGSAAGGNAAGAAGAERSDSP